jgi:hypothetical protein
LEKGVQMRDCAELIDSYENDVRFPDVSPMEQLETLLTRSEIAACEADLSIEQRLRLAKADNLFRENAPQFYESIRKVVDLERWRRDENTPEDHWWWYLEVLAQ